jgi:branched-chain amino acid transport system permease protein
MIRTFSILAILAALAAVLAFPLLGSAFYTELLAKAMILAIFALSLDLLVGFTGLVSLGLAEYFCFVVYSSVVMSY